MTEKCFENVVHLKKNLKDFEILVINNNSNDKTFLSKLDNYGIKVEDSIFNGAYDPGALLQAYNIYEAENYLLIQDSIKILDFKDIEKYINNNCDYVLALQVMIPAAHALEKENIEIIDHLFHKYKKYIYLYPGICNNTFLMKRKHVAFLVNENILIEENLPKNKFGQECWERIFGICFSKSIFKLKTLHSIYDSNLAQFSVSRWHENINLDKSKKIFEKYYLARE